MHRWMIFFLVSALVVPVWSQQGPRPGNNPPQGQRGPGQPPQPIGLSKAGFSDAEIKAVKDDKSALDQKSKEFDDQGQALAADRDRLLAADAVDANAVQADLKKLSELQFQRDWAKIQLQIQWKTKYGSAKVDTLVKAFFPPQPGPDGPPPQP